MRSFFCFELSSAGSKAMAELSHQITSPAYVKWVDQANLHVTVKFLGDINEDRVPQIKERAANIASREEPFTMQIDKLGAFPSKDYPKVIWLGSTSAPGTLYRIQEDLEDSLTDLGFDREKRDYIPHITLGRTKEDEDRKIKQLGSTLKDWSLDKEWTEAEEYLTLMESQLRSGGPEYNRVFRVPLGST